MSNATDRIFAGMPKGDPDLLFAEDGSVRLPRLTPVAIRWSVESGRCFSRQPTRDRADAVAGAVADRLRAKGLRSEIRPGLKTDTFGVYIFPA